MNIISVIVLCLNFFVAVSSHAWESDAEMLREAEKATDKDFKTLKPTYSSREKLIEELSKIKSRDTLSRFYESYKDKAVRLIDDYTEFNGYGIKSIPPWTQIARITLGTDNLEKAIIGFIALGDIRGLSSFKMALQLLETSLNVGEIETLTEKFDRLRIGS